MNHTFARMALALLATTGCADLNFSYVEDGKITVPVKDIGSACETDDPVDTDILRTHIEQVGDMCVMTADALVRAIEYADLEDSVDEVVNLAEDESSWPDAGFCWRPATEEDAGQAYEKCDFGPYVKAEWRLVGEEEYQPDPAIPEKATAWLEIAFYPGPAATLDDVGGTSPSITYSTTGTDFPQGVVGLAPAPFFEAFEDAIDVEEDVWSEVHAEVNVPMAVIADFTEYEYRVTFAYQMYVQGAVENEPFWELLLDGLSAD